MKKSRSSFTFSQCIFRCGLCFIVLVSISTFLLIHFQSEFVRQFDSDDQIVVYRNDDNLLLHQSESRTTGAKEDPDHIHIAMVTCGDDGKLNDTLVSLKSMILWNERKISFHLFADEHLHDKFRDRVNSWPSWVDSKMEYTLYPVHYPRGNSDEWRALFKPCSSLRLFLPEVLPGVDSLIYFDTDTITLAPLDELYHHFSLFNSTQSMALTSDVLDESISWYKRFARHPFYGNLGLNSGVMLMNLTRMRRSGIWSRDIINIYNEYKIELTWGDQDIINIYLHSHPDEVYDFGCEWNYMTTYCMYKHSCTRADQEGTKVIHGNRGHFHKDGQSAFKRLYDVFRDFDLHKDVVKYLQEPLVVAMSQTRGIGCGLVSNLFHKSMDMLLDDRRYDKTTHGREG